MEWTDGPVYDGDGGVLLHKEEGDGDAHDVGAADHHGLLPLDDAAGALDQLDAALRRAGRMVGERLEVERAGGAVRAVL